MNLRQLRKSRELHPVDAAHACHVSIAVILQWEKGEKVPRKEYMRTLAELYGVPLEEIQEVVKKSANTEQSTTTEH